ncbi:Schwann cell myelin protein isoform X2 [Danio rerio]|uniref:Schwann cell myelin protein isoform X2 n=1 Tax=Danio rerio TaxID=7955 RepID=A0AC58I076_DANRE
MSGLTILVFMLWILKGAPSNMWEIKLPQKIDAISGFCVHIPCQFEIPDSFKPLLSQSAEALWKKTDIEGATVFSSARKTTSLLNGNVIGNILNNNCTTVFHNFPAGFGDTYFFRLQGHENLKYTFKQGVRITVHEDVLPPVLNPHAQVLEVLEGTKLTVSCSTVISCPSVQPLMQWNTQLEELLPPALQDEVGQTLLVSSQMFNATPLNDQFKISCSLLYMQGTKTPAESSITLRVLYAPRNTIALVSPSGVLSEGSVVTLRCQSDANPAVQRYEWYKYNGNGKLELQNQGQTITMTAGVDVQGLYVCKVYNNRGIDQSKAVSVSINGCHCSIAPYIICGFLMLSLILITAVDLVKYKSLLKRLQASENTRGLMTYASLHKTSDSVYNVIQPRANRSEDDYENRHLSKQQSSS